MTLAELRRWTIARNWGETRKQDLESFLSNYSIVHSNGDLCAEWAEVAQSAIRRGRPRPITNADAWIAVTFVASTRGPSPHSKVIRGLSRLPIRTSLL